MSEDRRRRCGKYVADFPANEYFSKLIFDVLLISVHSSNLQGVEIDERARSRDAVKAESVSQYVRNVAYGLLKPAMEQFEDSKVRKNSGSMRRFND